MKLISACITVCIIINPKHVFAFVILSKLQESIGFDNFNSRYFILS